MPIRASYADLAPSGEGPPWSDLGVSSKSSTSLLTPSQVVAALHFSDIESKNFLLANWSYYVRISRAGPYRSKSGAVTLNRNLKFYRSRPSDQNVTFEPNLTVLAGFWPTSRAFGGALVVPIGSRPYATTCYTRTTRFVRKTGAWHAANVRFGTPN